MKTFVMISVLALATLAAAAAGKKGDKPAPVAVAIKGMKFTPATVTIKVGDTVEWTNADQRDHTVVAADGSFSSGNIGHGTAFSFVFKKAGKFEYSCGLHPRMKGQIIVK